MYQHPELEFWV